MSPETHAGSGVYLHTYYLESTRSAAAYAPSQDSIRKHHHPDLCVLTQAHTSTTEMSTLHLVSLQSLYSS